MVQYQSNEIWHFDGNQGECYMFSQIFPCLNDVFTDVIRTIRDPEKPNTLEELDVVTEKCVEVQELGDDEYLIIIKFSPTVPHCSLATLIGVCVCDDKDKQSLDLKRTSLHLTDNSTDNAENTCHIFC